MIHQETGVDPTEVGRDVERVMSRPEFRYDPSWFDRLSDWVGERLEDLFGGPVAAGGTFGGGASPVVAWLVVLLAVAVVLGVVVYVLRNRVARPAEEPVASGTEIEHRRAAAEWDAEADSLEEAGEWKAAVRARYRGLVRTLVDRGQLPDVAGRTTGELRGDLAASTPAASAAFDTASGVFELAWYADVEVRAEDVASLRRAADEVLAARPGGRAGAGAGAGAAVGSS